MAKVAAKNKAIPKRGEMTEKEVPGPALIDIFITDNLLERIFGYLNLDELIIIERVSKKWKEISLRSWRNRKTLLLDKALGSDFPLKHIKDIFRRGGQYFTYVGFKGLLPILPIFNKDGSLSHVEPRPIPEKLIFKSISFYCRQLVKLELSVFDYAGGNLSLIDDSILMNLKSLYLCVSDESNQALTESRITPFIQKAVNLEELVLTADVSGSCLLNLSKKCKSLNVKACLISNEMFSKILDRLPNLKDLGLYRTEIVPKTISKISNNLVGLNVGWNENFFLPGNKFATLSFDNLRILDIRESEKITDKIFGVLVTKCPLLEELILRSMVGLTDKGFCLAGKLTNLKNLDMSINSHISNSTLVCLSKSLANLETFSCMDSQGFNCAGLFSLVDSCQKLSYINMEGCEITDKFCRSVLKSLDRRPKNRSLTIFVGHGHKGLRCLTPRLDRPLKYNFCKILGHRGHDGSDGRKWQRKIEDVIFYVRSV